MVDGVKNFDEFYETKLQPCLGELRKQSNQLDHWGYLLVGFVIAAIVSLASVMTGKLGSAAFFLLGIAVVGSVIVGYYLTKTKDEYEENFKTKIIKQVIEFLHPDLTYKPDICISSVNYKHSSLARLYYDDYDGNDLIEGEYKNVHFKCSELRVSVRASKRDRVVYKGLFFLANVNPSFTGGTYIWHKDNLQLPASIADERYRLMPMPEIVKVKFSNGEFEKYFSVYTTDVYEASSIVNDELMQNLTGFMKQIKREISMSIVAGICYVAIPFTENLYEPQGSDPGDKEQIKEYFFTVLLMLSIINQLKLQRLQ